ncbi:hypothetical protein [Thiohalophilus thiocyanatoxydans]|uniref:Sulfotransferase family protein n=1 Tax=Thiohalophilus thiocyanatoxydans TaxID=381308 RepID=A0A4R8IW60_9GAMM|nr:hypothetical protein [Thiohalophilus thiocyanatoxydans]TDY03750.1 hypothetical protein EDC23_0120 [Thiohalophilus thiocyanatoxydans]
MNVFILNTGRCGSTTFIKACNHITNFSSAHESRISALGSERLNYPKNHIEADNRLSWLLGRLDRIYGDNAIYVHLKRNNNDTAQSFTKRYSYGIIKAYRGDGILMWLPEDSDPMAVSLDYCDTVNSNIDLFLKDKTHKMDMNLESIEQDFIAFWKLIGAEGDMNAALAEFGTRHNASKQPQKTEKENIFLRILYKLRRLAIQFPDYIRNV